MWFRISEVIIAECIVWPVHLPGRCYERVCSGGNKRTGRQFAITRPLTKPKLGHQKAVMDLNILTMWSTTQMMPEKVKILAR